VQNRMFERGPESGYAPMSLPMFTGVPPSIVRAMLAQLATPAGPRDTVGSKAALPTRFGGVSLLLRDLDERPWAEWTVGWPLPWAGTPSSVLKWLTLAMCAGRAQALGVLEDAALRTLFGIPADVTTRDVSRWLRQVGVGRGRSLARDVAAADSASPSFTRREHAWLAFPRRAGIGRPWCKMLARIACTIMRAFARRLPGFAESTSDYLWRNFLSFDATIESEEERVLVRCGRPPLHLVLSLTGMTRGLLAGRDVCGRPILVFPSE
jgi:hypothetical protein